MPNGRRRVEPMPPDWWSLPLYDFLSDLPVQGWIWEFMRRARLKEVLGDSPVDAMNPNPELEEMYPDLFDYYYSYPTILRQNRLPIFFSPSVRIPGKLPKGYRHQQFSISDDDRSHIITPDLRIDLNRPNSVIMRDFKDILLELRESFPAPRRISDRKMEWARNRTIQIWDLKEFKVKWERVADLVLDEDDEGGIEKVKTTYHKVSKRYIDNDGWKYLARYVEAESCGILNRN